jgi:aminoglycoside phosphotransferase (APT) family kinase protein
MPLPPPDRRSLSPEWARAFDWIEANVGRIVGAEAQARWRPCYYLDAERDGEILPLYFRGDRGEADHGVYPLEHEMRVLQLLEQHELPVPHVHGFCPDPRGIVMERRPGRANLATAESDAEREAVLDQYVEFLARMHAIPVAELEGLGLDVPITPEALALGDFPHWERQYRAFKLRPEPLIEFAIRWIHDNVPPGRDRASLVHGDAGQFIFEAGRMTAVLDLELAFLGDPAADFAGMLCRDLSEPLGDLRRALATYERCTGEALDVRAIYYHAIRFGMCTPMVTAHLAARPPASLNWPQYQGWYLVYGRVPLELIAHLDGIELEAPELPGPTETRYAGAAGWLGTALEAARETAPDTALRYEIDTALRAAQVLERVDAYGPELEAASLDDAAKLLGHRPASWQECDAALEAFALEAPAGRQAELVRCLYRHGMRQEFLIAPAARELEGTRVQRLDGSR